MSWSASELQPRILRGCPKLGYFFVIHLRRLRRSGIEIFLRSSQISIRLGSGLRVFPVGHARTQSFLRPHAVAAGSRHPRSTEFCDHPMVSREPCRRRRSWGVANPTPAARGGQSPPLSLSRRRNRRGHRSVHCPRRKHRRLLRHPAIADPRSDHRFRL